MTDGAKPADSPDDGRRRVPKPLPPIEEVMRKPYLTKPDVATLMSTSVEGVTKMMQLGSIPPPLGKRGRRWFWALETLVAYMEGDGSDEQWTPPPYNGPKPPRAA